MSEPKITPTLMENADGPPVGAVDDISVGWTAKLTWLIIGLALLIRLLWLGMKPPHFDEGVNGWFVDQMTKTGFYHYDPGNYHGPFHFYVLFLAQTLFGRSIVVLRMPLVLINVVTIWLIIQYQRFLPRRTCLIAAAAFAVSTGMVFYSRYAIHESWFVFGMILGVWGLAEMWTRGTVRGLWCLAMGVTLLILTKETYIMHLVAFGLAGATLIQLEKFTPSSTEGGGIPLKAVPQQWTRETIINAVGTSIFLILFFYSGGFLDFDRKGEFLKRLFQTFVAWTHTGVNGNGHEKPFYYWLQLMGRYEWPAAIGFLFCLRALWPGMNRLLRYLAIYGCGALVAYSIVHYKTPWCIVSIIWPFLFLFGGAVDAALRFLAAKRVTPWIAGVAAGLVIIASLGDSIWLNFLHPTDANQPYVYVQTLDDIFKLTRPLQQLVAKDPSAYHIQGNIILSSYHPLPWMLGDFTNVGYYDKPKEQPSAMDAGFLAVEEDRVSEVENQLTERYFVETFHLRDAMEGGKLYLNYKQFAALFPGRKPEFEPDPNGPKLPKPSTKDSPDSTDTDTETDSSAKRAETVAPDGQ